MCRSVCKEIESRRPAFHAGSAKRAAAIAFAVLSLSYGSTAAQEAKQRPVSVSIRVGGVPTPEFASDCGHGHGLIGLEVKSNSNVFGFVAADRYLSLGGDDIQCLGPVSPSSSGSFERSEQGFTLGGAGLFRFGVGYGRRISFVTLEGQSGAGVISAESLAGSYHAWGGVEIRAALLSERIVLSYTRGAVRFPRHVEVYQSTADGSCVIADSRDEKHWGALASATIGVRF